MPITVEERFDSRRSASGQGAYAELLYLIKGTDDDSAVQSALSGQAPETWLGLVLQTLEIEPTENPDIWYGTARYGTKSAASGGAAANTYTFETSGGTQHLTNSLETVNSYAASGAATNFKGAIGVTKDSVEGVDVTVPVYNFSENHKFTDEAVSLTYRGDLFRLTGKVNNAAFKGLNAGECLFLGASGSRSGSTVIVEQGDDSGLLSGFENVTGVEEENSDSGTLYWKVVKTSTDPDPETFRVEAYSDSACTTMVAHTADFGSTGAKTLIADGSSGIGGSVTVDQVGFEATGISVAFPLPWEITFRFAALPNKTGLTVGDITGIAKKGWEYLWVLYSEEEDTTSKRLRKVPVEVHIEKVYEDDDFADLQIGT